jgi:hypothetical protein
MEHGLNRWNGLKRIFLRLNTGALMTRIGLIKKRILPSAIKKRTTDYTSARRGEWHACRWRGFSQIFSQRTLLICFLCEKFGTQMTRIKRIKLISFTTDSTPARLVIQAGISTD